jgi:hypothetical protein
MSDLMTAEIRMTAKILAFRGGVRFAVGFPFYASTERDAVPKEMFRKPPQPTPGGNNERAIECLQKEGRAATDCPCSLILLR